MTKKNVYKLVGVLFGLFLSMAFVSAVQNFSVTPSEISLDVDEGMSSSFLLSVENTGNESLNLTVTKSDAVNGSSAISLNLSRVTILNLAPNASQDVTVDFNSGSDVGVFIGSVTVSSNADDVVVPVTVDVGEASVLLEASLVFEGEGNVLTIEGELGDEESVSFYLLNNGDVTIRDIDIDIDDLDGDDDSIDVSDIEINGDDVNDFDRIEELDPSERERIRITVDISDNIDVDTYRGDLTVEGELPNGSTYRREFTLKVLTSSDEEDVYFEDYEGFIRDKTVEILGEPGETIDNIEFTVTNDGPAEVRGLQLVVVDDLEEQDSLNTIDREAVSFEINNFDISDRDSEEIELEVEVPDDQATGTYVADVELRSADGDVLDEFLLKVRVIGDIYIKTVDVEESINPGDNFDVSVVVRNKGARIVRSIQVTGTLIDADFNGGDVVESSSNFILTSNSEKEVVLRFSIPEDARDGDFALEIEVEYDDQIISQIESVSIERPLNNIVVESFGINPTVAKCEDEVFTFIKYKNLGRYDKDVYVIAQIEGTNIKKESQEKDLNVDDVDQSNLVLDISSLEPGVYNVVHRVVYDTNEFVQKESSLRVINCSAGGGIDVKPINDTVNESVGNQTDDVDLDGIDIFGTSIDRTTLYLGTGVGIVFIFIIIGLFLL